MRLPAATPTRAALAAGVVLIVVYAATLAPGVTFWDAGEFAAAVHSFGVPHPPGTPLYIAIGRAWTHLVPGGDTALATNLLSAVATSAAMVVAARLAGTWLGDATLGAAGAICAGTMTTVWLGATETEVYALALLATMLALWCADRAGRSSDARWTVLTAYGLGLALPLHLYILVATPAAMVLVATPAAGGLRRAATVAAATLMVAGVGRRSVMLAGAGALGLALIAMPRGAQRRMSVAALGATLLAISGVLIMLVRARHDPVVNQGDPSTLAALLDVVARRQYAVAPLWPRQAPAWLQIANLFEWADWQVALGLGRSVAPTIPRTTATIVFAALGIAGALAHRRRDRRSWLAVLMLLISGSVGVVVYLNLKAGPSFGWGILTEGAPREARERDYFFVLAFVAWGLWAGIGAVSLALRWRPGNLGVGLGLALAALPIALNWRAMDRRREPEASLPSVSARALLESSPRQAVLVVGGDNDTYPLWAAQEVAGTRRDVVVVTVPLLPAPWYRAELARRHRLLPAEAASRWSGLGSVLALLAERARATGRPLAVAATVDASERRLLGDRWRFTGLVYVADQGAARGTPILDAAAAARAEAMVATTVGHGPPAESTDPVADFMWELLRCPALARRAKAGEPVADSLDTSCNFR